MASIEEIKAEQESEVRIESSANDLRQFISSHIWQDMLRFIRMNNEADTLRLISAESIDEIRTLQGRVEVGKQMESLPELLIELLESDQENDAR